MARNDRGEAAETYPVRVAASMTGLKPELIRAWETRYDAVAPGRSEGGSRRYSEEDLHRLRLLRDVVDAGHRISKVARLSVAELRSLLPDSLEPETDLIEAVIAVAQRLDGNGVRRLLSEELSRRGPVEFATGFALPLLFEIGQRWESGTLSISAEHLATGSLRSLLLSIFDSIDDRRGAPKAIFATPSGERHDLGTLIAALVAMRAGADIAFLGADVPSSDLAAGVIAARASILVLGIVTLPKDETDSILRDLRARIPDDIGIWIGGSGIHGLAAFTGIERINNLDQLEAEITLLSLRVSAPPDERRSARTPTTKRTRR